MNLYLKKCILFPSPFLVFMVTGLKPRVSNTH